MLLIIGGSWAIDVRYSVAIAVSLVLFQLCYNYDEISIL